MEYSICQCHMSQTESDVPYMSILVMAIGGTTFGVVPGEGSSFHAKYASFCIRREAASLTWNNVRSGAAVGLGLVIHFSRHFD